jgi:hypothetical protein
VFARQSEEMNARLEVAAARQEKANAEMKAGQAEIKASQAEMEARAGARQDKADAKIEAIDQLKEEIKARQEKADAEAKACHERFLAFLDGLTSHGKATTTCETETTSNPDETKAAVERQELFKEETYANNIGSWEDRSGYRRLVVRRRRGAKERIQDSVGPRQKLSAARKRVMRRAASAVRKENIRKGPGWNSVRRIHPLLTPKCHVLRMGSVTNNSTRVRIGYRIYSLRRLQRHMVTIATGYNYRDHYSTGSFSL